MYFTGELQSLAQLVTDEAALGETWKAALQARPSSPDSTCRCGCGTLGRCLPHRRRDGSPSQARSQMKWFCLGCMKSTLTSTK